MKKIICIILATVLSFSFTIAAFAEMAPGFYIREDGTTYYDIENYNRNIEKEQNAETRQAVTRTIFSSVPIMVYEQITTYFCGPASGYMLLDSLNVTVPSETRDLPYTGNNRCKNGTCNHGCPLTLSGPQVKVAVASSTSTAGSDIDRLRIAINNLLGTNYYADYRITDDSAGTIDLINKVSSALEDDHPVIVWVDGSDLYSFTGRDTSYPYGGHFVCLYSININTKIIGVADCNYYQNVGGKYTISAEDLRDAMYRSNGANNLIW